MKKLILHVGLHKTGSTAIQRTCHVNRARLASAGYCYPQFADRGWENHSVPLSVLFMIDPLRNHHMVADIFKTQERLEAAAKEIRAYFAREISASEASHIILSGEDISLFSEQEILNLKHFLEDVVPNLEIQVVVYVRDPVTFALSNAQEWVRAGKRSLGQVLAHGNLLQAKAKIEKFRAVFGASHVAVVCFENAVRDTGDVSKHFLQLLGISVEGFEFFRSNEAMPLEKILVASALIRIEPALVRHALRSIPDDGSRLRASEAVVKYICGRAKQDVEYLAEMFGIHYGQAAYKEEQVSVDRAKLLRNIYIVRKLSCEKMGRELSLPNLFEAICNDIGPYFSDLERFVVAMAYNCTLSPKFKRLLDEWVEQRLVHGKYVQGLFMLEGDELNPDEFAAQRYLTANPDVAKAGVDPFFHYYAFGRFAGRQF